MVLPGLVAKLNCAIVVLDQLVGIVEPAAFEDPFQRDHVRQRLEFKRLQVVDDLADFDVPFLQQAAPILEIEARSLEELRNACRDLIRRDRDRAHVEIAVVDAVIDAIGGRHHQVTRIVLAEAFAGIFDHDRVERPKRRGPVLRVAEPESLFVDWFQLVEEQGEIGIEILPALRTRGRFQVIGTWETCCAVMMSSLEIIAVALLRDASGDKSVLSTPSMPVA